jgi:phage gp29-like protein
MATPATTQKKNGQVKLPTTRTSRAPALKIAPQVSADTVQLAIRTRFNPIRGLTPQLLSQYLDQYNLGWIAYAALLWDMMERRDDVLKNVAGKRKKDAARLEWQVHMIDEQTDEAKRHQEALEVFYSNCTAVNALDENELGGFQMLVRQMMDATGKKYAVHEIVWQPGDVFTAQFRYVPLWFFENRTGRLQIMPIPIGGAYGSPLEEGGWMITCGDGLMEACSVAYMFKHLPLKDWLSYSDKFGTPGVLGQTNASRDSEAGQAMKDAVSNFGQNWSAVVYGSDGVVKDPIKLIEASTAAQNAMPFPLLIERMDRAMISLWRGADLATMSRGGVERSIGASVQSEESEILLRDDADNISETLNMYVDKFVIWQLFGTKTPLARIELKAPEDSDVDSDLKVDELLLNSGARLGERERLSYYGRPQFDETDIALHEVSRVTERITPGAGGAPLPPGAQRQVETLQNMRSVVSRALRQAEETLDLDSERSAAILDLVDACALCNTVDKDLEKFLGPYRDKFLKAFANDLTPLRAAIEHAIGDRSQDPQTQRSHLLALRSQLGLILRHIDQRGTAAEVLAEIIANSMKQGAAKAKKQTKEK